MIRQRFALVTALTLLGGPALWAEGQSSLPSLPERSPQQEARDLFNQGLRQRDKAWKLEERAQGESEAAAAKLLAKARTQFERAAKRFERATELDPNLYQAWASLGYAQRRLGLYDAALLAYDRALALNPNFPEALEYRGEAYLGLDRPAEARQAHARLSIVSPEHARTLLLAIRDWVEARRTDPKGVAAEELEATATWVQDRAQTGGLVASAPATSETW